MYSNLIVDKIPLGLVFAIAVVVVLLAVAGGSLVGARQKRKGEKEEPIGSIVGATLGLLAFMLAFTFGMAASRLDTRKQLLLDETNAIGTAFLRADFLPEAKRTEARRLFKHYVDVRVEAATRPEKLQQAIADSEAIQDQLWFQVNDLATRGHDSVLLGLYTQALNEVIDLHSKRITVALHYHIPWTIWWALAFVTILAMGAVGYQFGISGAHAFAVNAILALSFSAILTLIADLDRPTAGVMKVDQKPMLDLQKKLSTVVS